MDGRDDGNDQAHTGEVVVGVNLRVDQQVGEGAELPEIADRTAADECIAVSVEPSALHGNDSASQISERLDKTRMAAVNKFRQSKQSKAANSSSNSSSAVNVTNSKPQMITTRDGKECMLALGRAYDSLEVGMGASDTTRSSRCNEAIIHCKQAISLCRKQQRNIAVPGSTASTNLTPSDYDCIVGISYRVLGYAYKLLNLLSKSKASFVLAIKSLEKVAPSESSLLVHAPAPLPDEESSTSIKYIFGGVLVVDIDNERMWFAHGKALKDICALELQLMSYDGTKESDDIEDSMVDKHTLLAHTDTLRFQCTQCGECCRHTDNILLTPLDFFNISRSETMNKLFGIQANTFKLISHVRFKDAFHFMLKGGCLPICYLRPVMNKRMGRCHFAHELFVSKQGANAGGGAMYADPMNSFTYEEKHKQQQRQQQSSASASASSSTALPQRVYNSFGKPALGCLLGISNMPTMCASYPIAPELSIADFWHVRRQFWRPSTSSSSSSSSSQQSSSSAAFHIELTSAQAKIATGWQLEERFVSVATSDCEGFQVGNPDSSRHQLTPLTATGESLAIESNAIEPQFRTVRDFLASPESDLSNKLEHMQWFLGLIEDISSFLPLTLFANHRKEAVLDKYIAALAKLWYNFDSTSGGLGKLGRPIKSVARLVRDIEVVTWSVVRATKSFLQSQKVDSNADTRAEDDDAKRYENLLCGLLDIQKPVESAEGVGEIAQDSEAKDDSDTEES
jgi:hypothetical protein